MISKIILILIFCLAPAFVLWLCKKIPFFGKIGPILILYILGVIIGTLASLFIASPVAYTVTKWFSKKNANKVQVATLKKTK